MAIVLNNDKYEKIVIDNNIIIGVMGYNYEKFLKSLKSQEVFYYGIEYNKNQKIVLDYITYSDLVDVYLKELDLDQSFLERRVSSLSHSEKRLFNYLVMLLSNTKIIVINEPFLDLDYHYKKVIISLFNCLIKSKTIIIGSSDSNIIYDVCKKVLLLGKDDYLYSDAVILANKNVLRKYHLVMPLIIKFIRIANDKKNHLPYSKDIRDLIKDVYKNVTK